MARVRLTRRLASPGLALEEAIVRRRSERDFSGVPMSLSELSCLLLYSAGVTDERGRFRAAPSAGATYPMEVYPVVNNVDALAGGIYHYLVESDELELLREGDFRQAMSRAALGERMMKQANVILALAAVYRRTKQRYGERAYRYILFEAGHIAQNACLMATSMGLGSCAIGAFDDDGFNRILGLDGRDESVLYLVAVGKLR